MDQAEASGKTVDDALSRALKTLGATRSDYDAGRVEMTVLDEGRRGMLGMGAREARVRLQRATTGADLPQEQPPPDTRIPHAPAARAARGSRQGGDRGRSGAPPNRQDGGQRGSGQRRGGRVGFEQAQPKLTEADFLKTPGFEAEPGPAAETERQPGRSRGERGGQRREQHAPRERAAESRAQEPRSERKRRDDEPHIDPDINAEEVDFAAQTIDDLLRLLDITTELTIREPLSPGDGLGSVRAVIDISGDDLGLLIGRRGDTLLSLQYLVNHILSRQFPGRGGVSIDVEHYRHRRESQVMQLAQRMADRVRETGNPITLEPMPAAERRLIHLALADDPELETNSIGEGDNRKVVISARR